MWGRIRDVGLHNVFGEDEVTMKLAKSSEIKLKDIGISSEYILEDSEVMHVLKPLIAQLSA